MSLAKTERGSRVLAAAVVLAVPQLALAFPSPIQANPATEYVASIGVDYNNVQSFSYTLGFDINNPSTPYPQLYWFKYTSDGQSMVKFDTLGSNFGTSGGGGVLGTSNESQIAVYRANGQKVAISKGTRDLNGNPIPQYPTYTNDSSKWYYAQGLSELYFEPNAPDNPHWHADPEAPLNFAGWAAPGNEGNAQKYYQPYYATNLNEYDVWETALSTVMLDHDNNPVVNPATGNPRSQPGWRYYDRARHGPGTPWNRFEAMEAGDYYIAVASWFPAFAGDTYVEEVLQFPVHYDPDTGQNNQPVLTGPLGTFQYYVGSGTQPFGTINLNVTHTPIPVGPMWSFSGSGLWSDSGNWQGGVPNAVDASANFLGVIQSAATITLNSGVSVGAMVFDNANVYTITGSGSISVDVSIGQGSIDVISGKHVIDVPLHVTDSTNLSIAASSVLTIKQPLSISAGQTLSKYGPGLLVTGTLSLDPTAKLDVTDSAMAVDYTGSSPLSSTILPLLVSGRANGAWNGNGINSSSAAGNPLRAVGYKDTSITGAQSFHGENIDGSAILIAYTVMGDATLDGTVDSLDFNAFSGGYGILVNGHWFQGDFDYNGKIDTQDFNFLAGNFGASLPAPALGAVVPEPVGAMLLLPGLMLARRCRRR